jgi:hypothetical protein
MLLACFTEVQSNNDDVEDVDYAVVVDVGDWIPIWITRRGAEDKCYCDTVKEQKLGDGKSSLSSTY